VADSPIGEQRHGWARIATEDEQPNAHGWTAPIPMRTSEGPARVQFADAIDERHRCACTRDICQRPATQEDLRCDQCRKTCR
jgi:hypothetical protein